MSQPYNKYNNGVQSIGTKAINFSTDSFIFVLSNTGPTATTSTYSVGNVTEIATGGGYTQGTGIAITTTSFTNASGTSTWVGTAALFTATGAVAQFDYAILVDVTASNALLGWWQCVSAITMANTDTFQISWGSNQILTLA